MTKYSRTEYKPPVIPDGTHMGTLVEVNEGKQKKWQSEELEPCFNFKFRVRVNGKDEHIIWRTSLALGGKSRLAKFISQLAPGKKPIEMGDTEIDMAIVTAVNTNALFVLMIENNVKGDKVYPNIKEVPTLVPQELQSSPAAIVAQPTAADDIQVSLDFDDDDIPF